MILYVRPKADQVRETATLWEFELKRKGWNDLPARQQYGIVVEGYEGGWLLVDWIAVAHISMVTIDEIRGFTKEDKPIAEYTEESWNEFLDAWSTS